MNTDNTDLITDIKEYFKNIWDATLKGSLKAKALMGGAVLFVTGFYALTLLIAGEFLEIMDLPTRTGVLPSTVENVIMACLFWAGHKYLYTKAKEEL